MWIAFAAIAVFILLFAGSGHAASPLAGTSIGNQASATYVDGSAVLRTVSSNVVSTIVQQVAALTITQSLSKTAAAGTQVSYPVTLTNTGNGTDSFALTSSNTGGFTFPGGAVTLYADANGDGVADNTTPITNTGSLASGAVFRFVAIGNVPTTATNAQANALVITATSAFAGTVLASVTDTTTITSNAVINVNKTMSAVSGLSGSGPYTVTLSYNNTGNIAATGVTLTDALPVGMTYVPTSGLWSVTGATALTDATLDTQGTSPTIDYSVTTNTVKAIISTVAAGQSGTVSFKVNIDASLAAAPLNNTATFAYNDGAAAIPAVNTNTFVFTVNQTASLSSNSTTGAPVTVATAAQGSTVAFVNVFTNTGNATDSFDIAIGTSSFPAGSSFALYKADGVTPLVDTNGNGIPDTGPVTGILTAANNTYNVVLKVTLPAGVTGGPYSVTKTATSKFDPTKTVTGTDTLTVIAANTVDLKNVATASATVTINDAGLGAGAFAAPVIVTNLTNPGTTTRFTLNVTNPSTSTGDTFNVAASTDATFAALALPAGWTVVFRDSITGTVITNTGIIASNASVSVFADVTVPAGQAAIPAGQPITFRVLSPSTGSADRITDAVIVNTVRSVIVTPTNVGQVVPGGSVIYTHTITNAGNVAENTATSTVALTLGNTQLGYSTVVYLDANNNNIIDAGDVAINTAADLGALAAGATKQLLVKVTATSGVGIGVVNTTTLTATTAGVVNTVAAPATVSTTDTTTAISGNIVLLKEQALDANCDGVADTAYGVATITTGAIPTACISYRITATNNGSANVLSLVLSDATPASTSYLATVPAATVPTSTISAPANGAAGTVTATIGTLTPSASVVLTFGVKINP